MVRTSRQTRILAAALLAAALLAAPARAGGLYGHLHSITARDMGGPVVIGGVHFDEKRGRLYATDRVHGRILAFDASFAFVSEFTAAGALQCPGDLVRDPQDRFLVAEPCRSRVTVIDMGAKSVSSLDLPAPRGGNPTHPQALAQGPDGSLYVADRANARILAFGPGLEPAGEYALEGCRALMGLGVDGQGRLYALDALDGVVRVLAPDGREVSRFEVHDDAGRRLLFPTGLAVDAKGLVHVLDRHRDSVSVFDTRGALVGGYGRHGWREGRLYSPASIHLDGRGRVFVFDRQNARISIFE